MALKLREVWRMSRLLWGGDELGVICIEEADCGQFVGQVIDVDDK